MSASGVLEPLALSAQELQRLRDEAAHVAFYDVCGNAVRLAANGPHPIESFDSVYAFLRREEMASPPEIDIVCNVAEDTASHVFISNGVPLIVREPVAPDHMYVTIAYLAMRSIRTHFLFHAGAVERNGQAILVSGVSGRGKSTLTAFLVAGGMGYLSDEIAPLSRASCEVWPFPRHLGIRSGPAGELVADLPGRDFSAHGDEKRLIDPVDVAERVWTESVPLHAVVFLSDDTSRRVVTPRTFQGRVRVVFLDGGRELEGDLLALTGASLVEKDESLPRIRSYVLHVDDARGFPDAVRAAAAQHGAALAGLHYEGFDTTDFDRPPELGRVPASVGALELSKKISVNQKSELISSCFQGKVSRMIGELAERVADVAFYKLVPGRLAEMVTMIESLP